MYSVFRKKGSISFDIAKPMLPIRRFERRQRDEFHNTYRKTRFFSLHLALGCKERAPTSLLESHGWIANLGILVSYLVVSFVLGVTVQR